MSASIAVALAPEVLPPADDKRARSRPGKPRPPPRPYKKITAEILAARIQRLTQRLDRAKKQHESTRLLLTKYAHERFFREREAIEVQDHALPPVIAPLNDDEK
jgi:hypothetical protein